MFDYSFYIFMYLLMGGQRVAYLYSQDQFDAPGWLYPASFKKYLTINLFWPVEIILSFIANGTRSWRAAGRELRREARFFVVALMLVPMAVCAYLLAQAITNFVIIKIILSFLALWIFQKILGLFIR